MWVRSRASKVDALIIKPGPMQASGAPRTNAVGGVVVPTANYFVLALLALFVLWVAFRMFGKRGFVLRFYARVLSRYPVRMLRMI